jgi:2'-5' RNA ligase
VVEASSRRASCSNEKVSANVARVRTFVAIEMSPAVRRQAQTLIHQLAARTTAVRWVSADQLHLTLKFLGDVEDKRLYDVCCAVDRAVAERPPFEVLCRGFGAFPQLNRPRTLWLGLEDPAGRLADLQERVEAEFTALGFPREVRAFRPHVTLGRVDQRHRQLGRFTGELGQYADRPWGSVPVKECVVYTSELSPAGPSYTAIGHSLLSGSGA